MIRPPLPSDQGYIAATWARSVLSTHAHQRHLSSRTGAQVGKQIDSVLDRPDTKGLLFVRSENPNSILGWIVYTDVRDTPVVHYLYTRARGPRGADLRGKGIATSLLRAVGVDRSRGVVCTSHGPSSASMRGRYRASVHLPLEEFLKP